MTLMIAGAWGPTFCTRGIVMPAVATAEVCGTAIDGSATCIIIHCVKLIRKEVGLPDAA